MLTVQAATDFVLQNVGDFGTENIPLSEAIGRILAEPLVADRDFPPFDRVTMDGIAILYKAFANGEREFLIEGLQAAGAPQMKLRNSAHCIEVMTGAMLPEGTDTVIRYEDAEMEDDVAKVQIEEVQPGQNIHLKGADRIQGDIIVNADRLISAAEIGVAATVGKASLLVRKLPSVIIISTGNELIPVDKVPLVHQIRISNSFALQALLSKWCIKVERLHLPDDRAATIEGLKNALKNFDLTILSGGVSMGKLDYVPESLSKLGVRKMFHMVQQRPGKPFWFGKAAGGAMIFALPGNPVSAFLCAVRYVEPWLRKSLGLAPIEKKLAILAEDVVFKPNLTYFVQVQLEMGDAGKILAKPMEGGGSGDLANLTDTDGFLELPAGRDAFRKGEVFPFWQYR